MDLDFAYYFLRNPKYYEHTVSPYDWTFTSIFTGSFGNFLSIKFLESEEEAAQIFDKHVLMRMDPILHSQMIEFYEDELGDNGCVNCAVKFVSIFLVEYNVAILLTNFLESNA